MAQIYAVDFDGTLVTDEWPEIGKPNKRLIEFLKAKKKAGDKLILWTCRSDNQLLSAVSYCESLGLTFDAVNDNLPEVVGLYGGSNSRKITADVYIDDKCLNVANIQELFSSEGGVVGYETTY